MRRLFRSRMCHDLHNIIGLKTAVIVASIRIIYACRRAQYTKQLNSQCLYKKTELIFVNN